MDKSNRSYTENYTEIYEEFWEQCDRAFAHLDINDHLVSQESLYNSWKRSFVKYFSWEGKSVADYGIGGGYLGQMLLSEFEIAKYSGIDISQRSLDEARDNLNTYTSQTAFYKSTVNFSTIDVDIFVSLACIQHFPNQEYLDSFLTNINNSTIPDVMLQIRRGNDLTFQPDNPILSCVTNYEYMSGLLSNYMLTYASFPAKNNYQYLVLKHK